MKSVAPWETEIKKLEGIFFLFEMYFKLFFHHVAN